MAARQLSDARTEGTNYGQGTTDKIGFYGLATPIAQRASTDAGAITAGASTTACNTLVIELRASLVALGLIKGAA
ncbi:hypothetical protein UFOVP1020_43 [uncultured Caudovirales phage]|uniref:Head fiber protein n=1 Tax=uncultured Caudovirales phage TaxID=2100421 RepID=A0A6J5Q5E7_9CAUD|nr:hypothetical protein UFOVP512_48 [uncultured Caudovirales phage]CAB4178702.1 hypothetical protein UFOVP1020_43 [uncultured Caudovirales phage]CAB4188060.1 hypothetical protein UFOVP1170_38 [uncultured Caudovirales phage]CAB4220274.1 hypothetical protein UFOVP1621_7 [uncultured Caudovirales phage]